MYCRNLPCRSMWRSCGATTPTQSGWMDGSHLITAAMWAASWLKASPGPASKPYQQHHPSSSSGAAFAWFKSTLGTSQGCPCQPLPTTHRPYRSQGRRWCLPLVGGCPQLCHHLWASLLAVGSQVPCSVGPSSPTGVKLEQADCQLKAIAEDARSVDSIEFASVSGFGGEAACASSLSNRSAFHLSVSMCRGAACLSQRCSIPVRP